MKVLSIDWDFFQNVSADILCCCYPDGLDLSNELAEIVWGSYYSVNSDKLRKNVLLLRGEYEKMIKILLNQDTHIPMLITNSHAHAYQFIHDNLNAGDKVKLINVDMHHDYANESDALDCGNWIGKLAEDGILDTESLGWIHNPVSFEMYGIDTKGEDDFSRLLYKLDKGERLSVIENEKFDLVVFARSDMWSAPHLDKYFCLLTELAKNHFCEIKLEHGIDKPRTSYLKYAVEMKVGVST